MAAGGTLAICLPVNHRTGSVLLYAESCHKLVHISLTGCNAHISCSKTHKNPTPSGMISLISKVNFERHNQHSHYPFLSDILSGVPLRANNFNTLHIGQILCKILVNPALNNFASINKIILFTITA